MSSHSAHNTITLALTGALAALVFSATTAQASPDAPTPIGDGFNVTDCCVIGPWQALEDQYYQDFSVPNDPADTFEGLVREDSPFFGFSGIRSDYNVYVEKDIAGNVPVGEQYNSLNFDTEGFNLVYNTIGGTPEAAYITPFGDLNFPTWFVEAVGPSLFEPSFYTEPPLSNATMAAAELPAQAFSAATDPPDAPTPIAGTDSPLTQSDGPWFEQLQYSQDFSVLNAPEETFEGVVRLDTRRLGPRRPQRFRRTGHLRERPRRGAVQRSSLLRRRLGRGLQRASAARRKLSTPRRSVTSTFPPGLSRR